MIIGERAKRERDTLRSVQSRIAIYVYTRKMVPIMGRASELIAEIILYER